MITSEEATEIAKKYLIEKKREYLSMRDTFFEEGKNINYGKYENTIKNIFVVPYEIEGYQTSILHFISIDAESGEVLFTTSPHGYVEEWED